MRARAGGRSSTTSSRRRRPTPIRRWVSQKSWAAFAQAELARARATTVQTARIRPLANTTALGGVPTGSMKPQLAASVAGGGRAAIGAPSPTSSVAGPASATLPNAVLPLKPVARMTGVGVSTAAMAKATRRLSATCRSRIGTASPTVANARPAGGSPPRYAVLTLRQIEVIRAIMVTGTIVGAARLLVPQPDVFAAVDDLAELEMQIRELASQVDTGAQDKQMQLSLLGSSDAVFQERNRELAILELSRRTSCSRPSSRTRCSIRTVESSGFIVFINGMWR